MSETKFSQSAAVSRCRNVKESKLKAQHAIAKLADEEVTVFSAQLEDSRHQLSTQLQQQSAVGVRQSSEALDVKVSWERKQQLNLLIDKLTTVKKMILFQQESGEREAAFKAKIREKRSAFQVRLANLEKRQWTERNELLQSQQRLAETVSQIRAIEIKSLKDKNQARRMKRDNEIQIQQVSMRQQKESEFLREIQLCKARQLGEINDLEIRNLEEIEELTSQHRVDEYTLVEKQIMAESEMSLSVAKQKFNLEAGLLLDKQTDIKAVLARAQKKQSNALAKAQRAAMRAREKSLLSEHPLILGEASAAEQGLDNESEAASESMGSSVTGGSITSLQEEDKDTKVANPNLELLEKNSAMNKTTHVLSEHEKEIVALTESGNERLKNLMIHHKKILSELKQMQRGSVSQKTKEHRRKLSELVKEHEEEIEQVKVEQAATMQELLQTHLESEEMRADTAVSQNLLGMMLPGHIMEQIEAGVAPGPENFNCVTLFFTDIYEFKKLVGFVSPVKILQLLNVLYTKFDEIIARYSQLYKVESVSDTYMVCGGISSSHTKTEQEIAECAIQALSCCIELQRLVQSMDLTSIVGHYPIKLRIGIHSGAINAGLIGTKMSRYCLFGDTVNTASRMCTTGDANKIQVSTSVIQTIGADEQFEFEERGEIEVKGKGKMTTF
ncbi:Guanylate cyclase soluble subunit beta-2, partial [Podochytrium sp. JEL0797]